MSKLRIWLAYYIMPKDKRKYLIKALLDNIGEDVAELYNEICRATGSEE